MFGRSSVLLSTSYTKNEPNPPLPPGSVTTAYGGAVASTATAAPNRAPASVPNTAGSSWSISANTPAPSSKR